MGSYVTRIAERLQLDLSGLRDDCPEATPIGLAQMKSWRWIRSPRNQPQILHWQVDSGERILLPIHFPPIDPEEETTWLPPVPGAAAAQPPPVQPAQHHEDVQMDDALSDGAAPSFHSDGAAPSLRAHTSFDGAETSAQGAARSQGSWSLPQSQWDAAYRCMTETQEMVRSMQLMQIAQNTSILELRQHADEDRRRLDQLAEVQRQQGQHLERMEDTLWSVRLMQMGVQPSDEDEEGSDDDE